MKKTNKKYLIILLVVLLLGLAVGYAAMNKTLTIDGKATAKAGDFNVQFTSDCAITDAIGIDQTNSYATVNGDTLNVLIKDLHYPGAGATVHVVIKNTGTLPAKINGVDITDHTSQSRTDIKILGLDQISNSHPRLNPDGTCTFDFTVQWDPDVNTVPDYILFGMKINYEQDIEAIFTGTPSHTDA